MNEQRIKKKLINVFVCSSFVSSNTPMLILTESMPPSFRGHGRLLWSKRSLNSERVGSFRGGGLSLYGQDSHQLSFSFCDLFYWCVWKLLRWDEPRLVPAGLLGGQSVSRHQPTPSVGLSQHRPNLSGMPGPILSWDPRGPSEGEEGHV